MKQGAVGRFEVHSPFDKVYSRAMIRSHGRGSEPTEVWVENSGDVLQPMPAIEESGKRER